MGEDEHKISLFADDVMIYQRDPEISFTTLLSTDKFSTLRIQTKCKKKQKKKQKKTTRHLQ